MEPVYGNRLTCKWNEHVTPGAADLCRGHGNHCIELGGRRLKVALVVPVVAVAYGTYILNLFELWIEENDIAV